MRGQLQRMNISDWKTADLYEAYHRFKDKTGANYRGIADDLAEELEKRGLRGARGTVPAQAELGRPHAEQSTAQLKNALRETKSVMRRDPNPQDWRYRIKALQDEIDKRNKVLKTPDPRKFKDHFKRWKDEQEARAKIPTSKLRPVARALREAQKKKRGFAPQGQRLRE
jgi:hypothetical protein